MSQKGLKAGRQLLLDIAGVLSRADVNNILHQWRGAWAQCVLTSVIQLNYEASLRGRKSAQDK